MGPQEECEVLHEPPTSSYITGMLYPSDTPLSEDEISDDQEFMHNEYYSEDKKDSDSNEEYDSETLPQEKFKKQSSCGLTCYVREGVTAVTASINGVVCKISEVWGGGGIGWNPKSKAGKASLLCSQSECICCGY